MIILKMEPSGSNNFRQLLQPFFSWKKKKEKKKLISLYGNTTATQLQEEETFLRSSASSIFIADKICF